MTDHIAMSKTTLPRMVKETLEKRLRLKQDRDTNFKYMVPTNFSKEETEVDKKLVIYVEDLHLPMKDQFGHQQASEVLRDYFNFGGCSTSEAGTPPKPRDSDQSTTSSSSQSSLAPTSPGIRTIML